MPLQLSAIHRSKGSTAKAKPRRGIGSSDGVLALGTWKGAKLRSSETSFPEPTPMLAHYRPPVGSIPDSRTSKSQSRTRSRPRALPDLCFGIPSERLGHLDP